MVTIIQQLSYLDVPPMFGIFFVRGLWRQMCAVSSSVVVRVPSWTMWIASKLVSVVKEGLEELLLKLTTSGFQT